MKTWVIVICILVCNLTGMAKADDTLFVGFGHHNAPPYAFIKDSRLTGGVIMDIMAEAAAKLDIQVSYVYTPRKRQIQALESGSIHVLSMVNPAWFGKKADKFDWSISLFAETDLFVLSKNNLFPLNSLADLYGKNLGCILGYHYPGLADNFKNGRILRHDVKELEANFKKLGSGRIDALIDSDILIRYHLKSTGQADRFVIPGLVSARHDIFLAYSKKSPVPSDKMNLVLKELIGNRTIERILTIYQ